MSVSKYRIGKDITIKMSVLTNGEPVSLDGRDISVILKTPMCEGVPLDFSTESNVITAKYEGMKQKYCGMYMLTVWENYGKIGQTALDFCNAFELVSSTCKEVPSPEGLELETVDLEGNLAIGVQGRSAYEIAVANGFQGTEEEWLASLKGEKGDQGDPFTFEDFTQEQIQELQRPAADATDAANKAAQAASQAAQTATGAAGMATAAAESANQAASNATTASQTATEAAQSASQTEASIKQAESLRAAAEQRREANETARVSAETARAQAESERASAEQGRVSAESSRVSAEQGRVTAEQQRETEFATLKKDAKTATDNANTAAEKANQAAEGINDRLSETYANLDAIKASGETNPNKIFIDAETAIPYIYKDGAFVPFGPPKGGYNRALFEVAGAVYNEETGFYELNGLTDITEEQMDLIYSVSSSFHFTKNADYSMYFKGTEIRTNLLQVSTNYWTTPGSGLISMTTMCEASKIEVLILCRESANPIGGTCVTAITNAFQGCSKLKEIIGNIGVGNITTFENCFRGCNALESLNLVYLSCNVSFPDSPILSSKSILYMIRNSSATKPITITLHADAYAMAMADEDIQAALAEKTFVSLASA